MKKVFLSFLLLTLMTSITCENEPLEGDFFTPEDAACNDAIQQTEEARINYISASELTFIELCNAYKSALQNQIEICGDDGTIQAIIYSLGNCGQGNQSAECEVANVVAIQAETAYNNDNTNEELCNAYKSALQNKINFCGDTQGNLQAIIDDLGDCSSNTLFVTMGGIDVDFDIISVVEEDNWIKINGFSSLLESHHLFIGLNPNEVGLNTFRALELSTGMDTFVPFIEGTTNDFESEITANSSSLIVGTFGGTVVNSSGIGVDLTNGIINISY